MWIMSMSGKRMVLVLLCGVLLASMLAVAGGGHVSYAADDPTATPRPIKGKPNTAVTSFLRALAAKREAAARALICQGWQEQAQLMYDSFGGVSVSLRSVACRTTATEGEEATVACSGKIVVNYNGLVRSLDLSTRNYRVKAEGGAWKVCGYRE